MKNFLLRGITALLITLPLISFSQYNSIRINQLGYYPDANKIAVVVNSGATGFEIIDEDDGSVVLTGDLGQQRYWSDAGDSVRLCDFSGLTTPGTYRINIPGFGESYPFGVSNTVLRKAAYASLKSYYYQRCSYELLPDYAGLWARAAGHPDTNCVLHSSTGKSGTISSPGGWYDAGDYGKYVINAGISVATLLSYYENFNNYFEDSSILIPESGNGLNDLLDEVKYELDWLKTMQDEDGSVFVKLTTLNFQGFIMPSAATATRYVIGKSTPAALDFAAMMAMAGRIYQDHDPEYASDCISRAANAWTWAQANPSIYFRNPSDVSTGEYGDNNASDEFIWAAAELYITTGDDEYKTYLESKSGSLKYQSAPGWPNVQPLASLSLATRPNGLSESLLTTIRNSITSTGDKWIGQISTSPSRLPSFGYYWGSNSGIANMGVGLVYAWIVSGDEKYIKAAAECADYLLGKNATGFSFVSSYGYKTPMNFHHRPSGADGITQPVPGFVAGGPNKDKQDNQDYPFDKPAKSYVDVVGSYASNEVCINWNSPLTALLAGVDAVLGDGSSVDFEVPVSANNPPILSVSSPSSGAKIGSDEPFIVNGTASDPDGISRVELYIDARYMNDSGTGTFEWTVDPISFGEHTATLVAYDVYGLARDVTRTFNYVPVGVVPGIVEAEYYSNMSGITTQETSDEGGGMNLTSLQAGDWADYTLNVAETGFYRIEYRVASSAGGGKLELKKPTQLVLSTMEIEATGGSQVWTTIADTIELTGTKQNLRLSVISGGWNINWLNFVKIEDPTAIEDLEAQGPGISVFPNPFINELTVSYRLQDPGPVDFILFDSGGRLAARIRLEKPGTGKFSWETPGNLPAGSYHLMMYSSGRRISSVSILKTD